MEKDVLLVNKMLCENAHSSYHKLLIKQYGISCVVEITEMKYLENKLYSDLLISKFDCTPECDCGPCIPYPTPVPNPVP